MKNLKCSIVVSALALLVACGGGGEAAQVAPLPTPEKLPGVQWELPVPPSGLKYTLNSNNISQDLNARRIHLASLTEQSRRKFCDTTNVDINGGYWDSDGVIKHLPQNKVSSVFYPTPLKYIDWTTNQKKDISGFALFYQQTAQQRDAQLWFAFRDLIAGQRALDAIKLWASQGAVESCLGDAGGSCYHGYRFASSTLHTLDMLRDHPGFTQQYFSEVKPWFVKLMTMLKVLPRPLDSSWFPKPGNLLDPENESFLLIPPPLETPASCSTGPCGFSNHYALRGQLAMSWAAFTGQHDLFDYSIRFVFGRSLAQIRADGSIVAEIQRENYGLWYSNYHIGNMVMTAEIAAQHGHDIYSKKNIVGASLHDAVSFLVRASTDFSLVDRYRGKNCTTPSGTAHLGCLPSTNTAQEMRWLNGEFVGMSPVAWVESYVSRFPNLPVTAKLKEWIKDKRPLMDDMNGMGSCLFASYD